MNKNNLKLDLFTYLCICLLTLFERFPLGLIVCSIYHSQLDKSLMLHTLDLLSNKSLPVRMSCVFFDLILNVPSTIFQLYRDGSSCVEPVLS